MVFRTPLHYLWALPASVVGRILVALAILLGARSTIRNWRFEVSLAPKMDLLSSFVNQNQF